MAYRLVVGLSCYGLIDFGFVSYHTHPYKHVQHAHKTHVRYGGSFYPFYRFTINEAKSCQCKVNYQEQAQADKHLR